MPRENSPHEMDPNNRELAESVIREQVDHIARYSETMLTRFAKGEVTRDQLKEYFVQDLDNVFNHVERVRSE
jgi:hypothetical protein